jgi:hypothetical protein
MSVDFNTMAMDERERVLIHPVTQAAVIPSLRPGLVVLLSDDTLEVEARLEFDDADQRWWGVPDWNTSHDRPAADALMTAGQPAT